MRGAQPARNIFSRSYGQVREQYELERELAGRLRAASPLDRPSLYAGIYDELLLRLAHHPQRTRSKHRPGILAQARFLRPYLAADLAFLEIGAGDGALTAAIAPGVRSAYGLEVSTEVMRGVATPPNMEFLPATGVEIPLPARSIDLAYSYQVIEHLHPDDVSEHLHEVCRVLVPGGAYLCVTPNRLSGPHDISRHFDREATGLHLREYTLGELVERFRGAGFASITAQRVLRSRAISLPAAPISAFERLLAPLPWPLRSRVARADLVARALEIFALGRKASAPGGA